MTKTRIGKHEYDRIQMGELRAFLTEVVLEAREQGAVIVTRNGKDFCAIVSLPVAVAGLAATRAE